MKPAGDHRNVPCSLQTEKSVQSSFTDVSCFVLITVILHLLYLSDCVSVVIKQLYVMIFSAGR